MSEPDDEIPVALVWPWLGIASWTMLVPSAALTEWRFGRPDPGGAG